MTIYYLVIVVVTILKPLSTMNACPQISNVGEKAVNEYTNITNIPKKIRIEK